MTPLRPANFRIEQELLDALQKIKERDGVPVSEQVRRGIQMWVESRGAKEAEKTERKRPASRKRS